MRQVAQAVEGGVPRVLEVPEPALRARGVLVRTAWSLVSAGTDRLTVRLAGKSLAGKARSRPDQVKKMLRKLRSEGLSATVNAVRARLEEEIPLGYSAAGTVVGVGAGVGDLAVGDRVACAGAGHASHAEVLFVPRNLVARVPDGLDLRSASTVTLGAIALQGVRRAEPALGDRVGVVGLGMLGLLTVQILRSAGCHVFAVDLDPARAALARELGAEVGLARDEGDLEARARAFGAGHGLDSVIVTAASESSDPAILAAEMCRLGGRVVVVGAVGLDLPRDLLFRRELELRLSRSYGPGRYDPDYEEKGIDYPYPYVRHTEGRNLAEYLSLLGRGEVDVEPLLTHEFGIEEGERAYRLLLSERGREVIGLLFGYGEGESRSARRVELRPRGRRAGGAGIGLVGAGAFARSVLLPALSRCPGVSLTGVVTATGLSAVNAGRDAGFAFASTRLEDLLDDEETEAVVVATRHAEHCAIARAALRAGKDVLLEKPLALTEGEIDALRRAREESERMLMVGFNRRFAPYTAALRRELRGRVGPLHLLYRVNAGPLPAAHWTRDPAQGGRLLGEVCHFVDLLLFLVGAPPVRVAAEALPGDGVSATLRFEDGSVGSLLYAVAGDVGLGKERLEVFFDESAAVLEDFARLTVCRGGRRARRRAERGKGHRREIRAFVDAVRAGTFCPVPFGQAVWSTRATLAIARAARRGEPVTLRGS